MKVRKLEDIGFVLFVVGMIGTYTILIINKLISLGIV